MHAYLLGAKNMKSVQFYELCNSMILPLGHAEDGAPRIVGGQEAIPRKLFFKNAFQPILLLNRPIPVADIFAIPHLCHWAVFPHLWGHHH